MKIPLFKVAMAQGVASQVLDVLYSSYIGEGAAVKSFEEALAKVVDNKFVLTTNSGTSAIMMALRLAGVGPGDLVVSTPATCIATNEPVLALGAKPIWADVNPKTGNIDPESVHRCVVENNVKAIMCVHYGGYPCDLDELRVITETFEIPLIEDAAQALGALYRGNFIGYESEFACFSFQAIKYVTSVDGGALCVKTAEMHKRGRLMRWYGFDRSKSSSMRCLQDPPEYGYKFHMNDVTATIGLSNLRELGVLLERVRWNARTYEEELSGLKKVKLPVYDKDRVGSYWLFPVFVPRTDDFERFMRKKGIECSQVHGRNDKKTIFVESRADLPGVDEFYAHQVCIPVGWWLSKGDVEYIIECIKEYERV